MSEENVELVKGLYATRPPDLVAAFADEEFVRLWESAVGPLLHPDFEVTFPLQGTYRGVEGFKAAYRDWLQTWKAYRVEAERFIDAGEQVVVFSKWGGRTKTGEVEVYQHGADVWTIREGKVRKIDVYGERAAALEAAGLSE